MPAMPAVVAATERHAKNPGNKKKKQKRREWGPKDGATTAELEAIVFGSMPKAGGEDAIVSSAVASEAAKPAKKKRKKASAGEEVHVAAWHDPDDATLKVDLTARARTVKLKRTDEETEIRGEEYERRLRNQFHAIHGATSWAEKKPEEAARDDDFSDEEEEMPATSAKAFAGSEGGRLQPGKLDLKRLRDVNTAGDGVGPCTINALSFHPNSELLLTAGMDKKVRLWSIDGEENPKVSSFFFKKFPITEASFSPSGDQIFIMGRDFRMWGLDVGSGDAFPIRHMTTVQHSRHRCLAVGPCPQDNAGLQASKMYAVLGDNGSVLVCDVQTRQPVRTLRMSTDGVAVAFSPEKDTIFTADKDCSIYEYDLATGRCLQKTKDPWATGITSLALKRTSTHSSSPMLAVGTNTGNIDFFDLSGPKIPKEPTSTFQNLVTEVSSMAFHGSGELFAASSRFKQDALKVAHTGTMSCFQNWPTDRTPIGVCSRLDFSRNGGLMAIGNEKGRVLLYRVKKYEKG